MQILKRWAVATGALFATVWILSLLNLASFGGAPFHNWFVAAVVMGLVNALIRPVARLITAPLNCLTFGIMGLVVNAAMFWLVPVISGLLGAPVFKVSFLGALLGSILVSAITGAASGLLREREERDR